LQKYFPAYAAILGVLALLLFLSPQIAKLISADTPVQEQEILRNNDFKAETLNRNIWRSKTADKTNKIKIEESNLLIENSSKENNYTLLSQKIRLDFNKIYHLKISYKTPQIGTNSKIYTGILKTGIENYNANGFELVSTDEYMTFERYFRLDQTAQDPYFFIFLSEQGQLYIENVSLTLSDEMPDVQTQALESLALPYLVSKSAPPAPPAPAISVASSPTVTPASSKSATVQKSATAQKPDAPKAILAEVKGGAISIYPGWSVVGFDQNTSFDAFTSNELVAYQHLGGAWQNSQKDEPIFASKTSALVYSRKPEMEKVNLVKTDSPSSSSPSLGWNMLYNGENTDISDDSVFSFSDGKIQAKEYKIKELVQNKNASSEVYLIEGSSTGVIYKKINFLEEAIPAKTAFWFYVYLLP